MFFSLIEKFNCGSKQKNTFYFFTVIGQMYKTFRLQSHFQNLLSSLKDMKASIHKICRQSWHANPRQSLFLQHHYNYPRMMMPSQPCLFRNLFRQNLQNWILILIFCRPDLLHAQGSTPQPQEYLRQTNLNWFLPLI